ncbi:MAG: hypothetical protein ABSB78_05475 [Bacteroidota bacterium]
MIINSVSQGNHYSFHRFFPIFSFACIVVISTGITRAQQPYFYKGYDYGSDAVYNPISVILNGGFDMFQVSHQRNIGKVPFYQSGKNVLRNILDPIGPIRRYGWWNFLQEQVIPISFNRENAQYWPNYSLHLIGGGMEYTMMKEWYEYNNCAYPRLFSIVTLYTYHFINEITENDTYIGDNVDPIADLCLFDVGGIILFSFDNVNEFFSKTLNLADWSLQPSFSVRNLHLHNIGQFFSVKWKFPFSDRWHLFYYFGTNGMGGVSYKCPDGDAFSFGVGMAASDLILLNRTSNKKTLDLVWDIGFFYDRNNSLLASLSITKKTDYIANLNIYPGVVRIGNFSPGLWCAYCEREGLLLGLTVAWSPVGVAISTR